MEKMLFEELTEVWSQDSVRVHNTPTEFAKQNYIYVQMCGNFKTIAPYSAKRENLDSYLFIFTTRGGGEIVYDEQVYCAKPNTICLIDCTKHHEYYSLEQGWNFLWIHFYSDSIQGIMEKFFETKSIFQKAKNDTEKIIEEVITEVSNPSVGSELLISSLLMRLVSDMITSGVKKTADPMPENVMLFRDEILKNIFSSEISLEISAQNIGYSLHHMRREFKRFTGITPREYIVTMRINRAKELLKFSDIPIAEVAEMVGIDNVSHFINLFKEREMDTPLQYRKKWTIQ